MIDREQGMGSSHMHKFALRATLGAALAVLLIFLAGTTVLASSWPDLPDSLLHDYGVTGEQVAQISVGFHSGLWLPGKTISRAQFVKMADSAFQIPSANPVVPTYSDVLSETSYYYGYIEGAAAAGLIGGAGNGLFLPNALITRQQAAAIVARETAAANGYLLDTIYTSDEVRAILGRFRDGDTVSTDLQTAVAYAVDHGIMSGNSSGSLSPLASLTRIQAAVLLVRAGAPKIVSISPDSGSAAGGTVVAITGLGFAGLTGSGAVKFGLTDAAGYTVVSPTRITAVAPAGMAGTSVEVSVTNVAGTITAVAADRFSYAYGTPTVASVTPNSGPAEGGNTVVIAGDLFAGATAVMFGSAEATSFNVVSSSQIVAVAPPGIQGATVDVTVVCPAGTSAPAPGDRYHYGVPVVTSVGPAAGPAAGGNTVVITGVGLAGAGDVMFGAVSAWGLTLNSSTQITVVAPAGSEGTTVEVTVVGPAGTSAPVAADRYTYGAPLVTSVSPGAGPDAGHTSVTIRGVGFTGLSEPSAVRFGPRNALSYTVVSDIEILAVTPPGTAGTTVSVTVTNPAGTSPVTARYLYHST
jgi:hypothetical protein